MLLLKWKLLATIMHDPEIHLSDARTALFLLENYRNDRGNTMASYSYIASHFGVGRKTIIESIKRLSKYFEVKKGPPGSFNKYIPNFSLVGGVLQETDKVFPRTPGGVPQDTESSFTDSIYLPSEIKENLKKSKKIENDGEPVPLAPQEQKGGLIRNRQAMANPARVEKANPQKCVQPSQYYDMVANLVEEHGSDEYGDWLIGLPNDWVRSVKKYDFGSVPQETVLKWAEDNSKLGKEAPTNQRQFTAWLVGYKTKWNRKRRA